MKSFKFVAKKRYIKEAADLPENKLFDSVLHKMDINHYTREVYSIIREIEKDFFDYITVASEQEVNEFLKKIKAKFDYQDVVEKAEDEVAYLYGIPETAKEKEDFKKQVASEVERLLIRKIGEELVDKHIHFDRYFLEYLMDYA